MGRLNPAQYSDLVTAVQGQGRKRLSVVKHHTTAPDSKSHLHVVDMAEKHVQLQPKGRELHT